MIAHNPSRDGEAELAPPHTDKRERERLKKRRQRARRYDLGLKANGAPVMNKARSLMLRQFWEPKHPADCVCYDCLWGNR